MGDEITWMRTPSTAESEPKKIPDTSGGGVQCREINATTETRWFDYQLLQDPLRAVPGRTRDAPRRPAVGTRRLIKDEIQQIGVSPAPYVEQGDR